MASEDTTLVACFEKLDFKDGDILVVKWRLRLSPEQREHIKKDFAEVLAKSFFPNVQIIVIDNDVDLIAIRKSQ